MNNFEIHFRQTLSNLAINQAVLKAATTLFSKFSFDYNEQVVQYLLPDFVNATLSNVVKCKEDLEELLDCNHRIKEIEEALDEIEKDLCSFYNNFVVIIDEKTRFAVPLNQLEAALEKYKWNEMPVDVFVEPIGEHNYDYSSFCSEMLTYKVYIEESDIANSFTYLESQKSWILYLTKLKRS